MLFFFKIFIKNIKNKNLVHLKLFNHWVHDVIRFIFNLIWQDSTSLFNSVINIFNFRCANPET